jgi:hypothetical protein
MAALRKGGHIIVLRHGGTNPTHPGGVSARQPMKSSGRVRDLCTTAGAHPALVRGGATATQNAVCRQSVAPQPVLK